MTKRLDPEELILLEESLDHAFGKLFPGSSGTVYCPRLPPQGIVSEENGYRVCFLPEENKILIPLTLEDDLLGVFLIKGVQVNGCKDQGRIMGHMAGICLQNFLLTREKQTDPLTGLLNRPAFVSRIEQSIDLAARTLEPGGYSFELTSFETRPDFSLLAVAVTNLDQLNQDHGYRFGDSILCSVARELRELCPEQSLLSRYREQVFAILIPGKGPVQSKKTAVKLQQGLSALSFKTPVTRESVKIKVEIGSTNYPQDLHGSQLRAHSFEKARVLLKNAGSALKRGRKIDPGQPLPFSKILTHGGTIIDRISLDRVRVDLGYLHQAAEGQRFSVRRKTDHEHGRPGLWQEKPLPKGEIMLVQVGPDESLAEVLYVHEPGRAIAPGDAVTLTRSRIRSRPPEAGEEAHSPILTFQHFLWNWQKDKEQRTAFSLLLVRLHVPQEADVSENKEIEPLLLVLDVVRKTHGAKAIIGEYGSSSLLVYLPDLGPDESRKTAEGMSEVLQDRGCPSLAVGIGYYPCLDSTRAEILSNCRKALVHAQMLPHPRIASFDSQTLTISADRFYAHNDLPGACKEYGLALVLDPENNTARNSLGICLARLGQIDRAASEFQEVLRLEPENCLARYNLGYVSLKTGNRKKGIESFRKCLELDPDHVFSLLRLGLLSEEEHDLEQAETYYRQAITLPEGKKHAYRLLGKLAIKKGDPEQGRTSLQKALTHNPQDAETMHFLAWLYSEDGQDLEIAESLARKSSALRPERFDFVELLDSILLRQGKADQARLLWSGRTRPAP
ncbi:MAG: tetratricopeptide repeat protein [Desulfohalobiaceae bacterium]|nr:tetratricopeptide repeat protein [Desulfohalobiaceae bacterium]